MRISDWSSDVCSSDLSAAFLNGRLPKGRSFSGGGSKPRFRRCWNRVVTARATVGVEALSSKVVVGNGVIPAMAEQGRATLITGGAGYIGSHTVLALHQAGRRVVVLDDLSTGRRPEEHEPELQSLMRLSYSV